MYDNFKEQEQGQEQVQEKRQEQESRIFLKRWKAETDARYFY